MGLRNLRNSRVAELSQPRVGTIIIKLSGQERQHMSTSTEGAGSRRVTYIRLHGLSKWTNLGSGHIVRMLQRYNDDKQQERCAGLLA